MEVESVYRQNLQKKCYNEKLSRRRWPDNPIPSCEKLSKMRTVY